MRYAGLYEGLFGSTSSHSIPTAPVIPDVISEDTKNKKSESSHSNPRRQRLRD
jgi:hypothetical protein